MENVRYLIPGASFSGLWYPVYGATMVCVYKGIVCAGVTLFLSHVFREKKTRVKRTRDVKLGDRNWKNRVVRNHGI